MTDEKIAVRILTRRQSEANFRRYRHNDGIAMSVKMSSTVEPVNWAMLQWSRVAKWLCAVLGEQERNGCHGMDDGGV